MLLTASLAELRGGGDYFGPSGRGDLFLKTHLPTRLPSGKRQQAALHCHVYRGVGQVAVLTAHDSCYERRMSFFPSLM
eukprot:1155000-Pelagomonas_calceolata.AAC.10